MFKNSECIGGWLHRYEIVMEGAGFVKERCLICKDEVVFPVRLGRIDNTEYISYHMREVLMPQHPLYSHEYPNK